MFLGWVSGLPEVLPPGNKAPLGSGRQPLPYPEALLDDPPPQASASLQTPLTGGIRKGTTKLKTISKENWQKQSALS